jgi:hypothetical protein
VLSWSLSLHWIQMPWDSGILPWLTLVNSTVQSCPRWSTGVGWWNGWQYYNSWFWSWIIILPLSTFWSYPTTSPLVSSPLSSSIFVWNSSPNLGNHKSSEASLSKVNLILLHMPQTWCSLKWCACGNLEQKNDLSWQCWRCKWGAAGIYCHVLVVDSWLQTVAEAVSYQSWRARWDSGFSI